MAAMVQHITFNEFLPLVLGKSGIHEHGLTLYAKVGPRNGRRIHRETFTARHIRAWAHSLCKGVYLNRGRIHREKSTVRHIRPWAYPLCQRGSPNPKNNNIEKRYALVCGLRGGTASKIWIKTRKVVGSAALLFRLRSSLHKRRHILYAKVGTRHGGRIC